MSGTPRKHVSRRPLVIGVCGAVVAGLALMATPANAMQAPVEQHAGHAADAFSELSPEAVHSFPQPPVITPISRVIAAETPAGVDRSPARQVRSTPSGTLVLYDNQEQSDYNYLGELYAQMAGNLASRFGTWDAKPVSSYQAGDMGNYAGVVYVGANYDEPLPVAFLDDVLADSTPVLWAGSNIWQLDARANSRLDGNGNGISFSDEYGWWYAPYDVSPINHVTYKGVSLDRNPTNQSGVLGIDIVHPEAVTILGTAQHESDGSSVLWAVRSHGLTYVAENPFIYATEADRYLAFADLYFDLLSPQAPEQHRALARLEDISPMSSPKRMMELADVFYARKIPFSMAVYPLYVDPNGLGKGKELRVTFADRPKVVPALKYMVAHGGTIIQHGYTHQFGTQPNPYSGRSAADFEFFTAHLDDANAVIKDGPVPGDTAAWAAARMDEATKMMKAAGLAKPTVWEFPHYAASYIDYQTERKRYDARYERDLIFQGGLVGKNVKDDSFIGQFFPYEVVDVYGSKVIPENLGNVALDAFNQHTAVMPPEIVRRAAANLVVRDGFASFFYHAFYSPVLLAQLLDDITKLGYTFVSANDVLKTFPAQAGGVRAS